MRRQKNIQAMTETHRYLCFWEEHQHEIHRPQRSCPSGSRGCGRTVSPTKEGIWKTDKHGFIKIVMNLIDEVRHKFSDKYFPIHNLKNLGYYIKKWAWGAVCAHLLVCMCLYILSRTVLFLTSLTQTIPPALISYIFWWVHLFFFLFLFSLVFFLCSHSFPYIFMSHIYAYLFLKRGLCIARQFTH